MKKYIYIILIFVLGQQLMAQQNNTMYFMESLPQVKWMNPAVQNECKIHIGGALIPVTGQVLLPMHLNYGNNSFALKDMLQYNSDLDSLILPGFKGFDWDHFDGKLKEVNYITQEFHLNLLSFGFKHKTWYFGLDINEKFESRFSFNKDLITFAKEGNGKTFLDETANLGDLGITATSYTEIALSASKAINDKLTIGVSAKLLMGRMNVWTEKSVLDITTNNNDNYPMTVDADVLIHSSQPFENVKDMYYDFEGDSMVFESESNELNAMDVLFNAKNLGLGFDFGMTYAFNDQVELFASVVDLGFVTWKDNAQSFSVNGSYYWDGYDFQPSLTDDEAIITESNDSLKNHIISIFEPQMQKTSYTSYLSPKVYLGGSYRFNEKIKTGLLLRTAFYQKDFHPSLTLSGNFRLTKAIELVGSYSMINSTYNNVGLGFAMKAKWFQFFMMTDNVWGFVWPQSTQNVNFRMGINLIFGCKKETVSTLIGG